MKKKRAYSKIIAGTMTWGSWGKNLPQKNKIALMHHCLDIGITSFDHADIYGGYTNENDYGKALAQSRIPRDKIQLITKCGIQYVCGARDNKIGHYDYSKEYIISSAEQSLKNLRTNYLDLFLLHRPSPLMQPNEIAEAIYKLQKDGKIKEFGVSNFTSSQIAMLEKEIPVMGNQIEFSLTMEKAMYNGTLDDAIAHQRMVMSWSPLGVFFKENTKQTQRIQLVLESLMEKYGAKPDELLLAWILRHPSGVYPVVGTTTPSRLNSAVKALELDIELEDWFFLLAASQGHKVP